MRNQNRVKLVIFTIILFSIITFAVIRYLIIDKSKRMGELRIVSSPVASLFINNNPIDRPTPYNSKYKPGEYSIKLIPRGDATSSASWEGKVMIYSNTVTYINRELGSSQKTSSGEILIPTAMKNRPTKQNTGEINIETEPIGAIIKLDNDEKGVSPLLLSEVSKGVHEISVSLPGYFPKIKKINIETGYRINVLFKLAIDQSQVLEEENASKSAELKKEVNEIEITQTEVGFLRVRQEPNVNAEEVGRVNPGDIFKIIEEAAGWIKINYESNKEGWVSKTYTKSIN